MYSAPSGSVNAVCGGERSRCGGPWTIRAVSVDHYENFPVASWLCPPHLRPPIRAIYAFARTADDLADEGDAPADERLADLAAYRRDLAAAAAGRAPSPRWAAVFEPLAAAMHTHRLPEPLLADLLSAFEQDTTRREYADRADLLDYCRRSANPVGRLLLHLYRIADAQALQQSDAVCTALQLVNFWQDLRVDTSRGRLYLPLADLRRHGVDPEALRAGQDSPAVRNAVADAVTWARTLMWRGAPLVNTVGRQAGWRAGAELRFVVQGGLRIAEKIDQLQHATLITRPTIGPLDAPLLAWRAWRMGPARPAAAQETA